MLILGIETSCDETAVALVKIAGPVARPRFKILSDLIASQDEIHASYGGIVPELASRRHLETLQPLLNEAMKRGGIRLEQIDGIAATYLPGLVGSLLVGLTFAKGLAYALKKPFIGVSHLEGHLNAPFIEQQAIPYPQIGLIVSGGHTALYQIRRFGAYELLGATRDDAAGEAFDKVAKLLELGYPGGPAIDRLARQGNPQSIPLPRTRLKGYDFSFSGLKTAMKKIVGKAGDATADLCASFQETVVDQLIEKTVEAARRKRCREVLLTGGVACNSRLREKLQEVLEKQKRRLWYPSPRYCTDNGAMIAYTGGRHLMMGQSHPLTLNAFANLDLKQVGGDVVS